MKNILLIGSLIFLAGCAEETNQIFSGQRGEDGSSCSVHRVESGATISCQDGTEVTVNDGQNGIDGQNGVNGQDGANGRDGRDGRDGTDGVSIVSPSPSSGGSFSGPGTLIYSSSTCTLINGTTKYIKVGETASSTIIYSSSTCSSTYKVIDFSTVSSYWVGSTSLAKYSNGSVQVITF